MKILVSPRALLLVILVFLSACAPTTLPRDWSLSDVRLLDAVDSPTTTRELIALYTRIRGQELQIRLDLLDSNPVPDFDLYLALDNEPGGTAWLPLEMPSQVSWDVLLIIPASGSIQVLKSGAQAGSAQPAPGAGVRVLRNPQQDSLEVSLNRNAIGNSHRNQSAARPFEIQAILTAPGSPQVVDLTEPVNSEKSPQSTAPVLLAFWNTLPAYTPAQALRRWDGAHTGPQGGRHGLYNLLRTAHSAQVPVVLLDLNSPASLAALDYLGKLEWVKELTQRGQLILPEKIPAYLVSSRTKDMSSILEQHSKEIHAFGLPSEPFIFLDGDVSSDLIPVRLTPSQTSRILFLPTATSDPQAGNQLLQTTTISKWQGWRVIPIPGMAFNDQSASGNLREQASPEGLSKEVLQALVATALHNASLKPGVSKQILVLGGNLPTSDWGIPQNARAAFEYILSHPWIKVVGQQELLSLPVGHISHPITGVESPIMKGIEASHADRLLAALSQAPHNPAGKAARQAFEALLAPIANPPIELPALRLNYINQVYALLTAAHWVDQPTSQSDCSTDFNHDSRLDCILASDNLLALFDSQDGSLTYLFSRTPDDEIHQVIGPSSQFVVGLSDPSGWDLSRGLRSDPAVIPGAFSDSPENFERFGSPSISLSPGELTFTFTNPADQNAEWKKKFFMLEDGLRVEYQPGQNQFTEPIRIPFALDPWQRFSIGWAEQYQHSALENGWLYSITPGIRVEMISSNKISFYSFLDSRQQIDMTEDPNLGYPKGHFLPFPVGLAEITPGGNLTIELHIQPVD